jgi:hypothetical protein
LSFSILVPVSLFYVKMGPEIILYLGGSIILFHFFFKKMGFILKPFKKRL